MCDLYNMTKGRSAIRDLLRASHEPCRQPVVLPAVFPGQLARMVGSVLTASVNS